MGWFRGVTLALSGVIVVGGVAATEAFPVEQAVQVMRELSAPAAAALSLAGGMTGLGWLSRRRE